MKSSDPRVLADLTTGVEIVGSRGAATEFTLMVNQAMALKSCEELTAGEPVVDSGTAESMNSRW